MGLALLKSSVSQSDVEVAWATYRALIIAEVDDPELMSDGPHQLAIARAKRTYERLFDEWCRQ